MTFRIQPPKTSYSTTLDKVLVDASGMNMSPMSFKYYLKFYFGRSFYRKRHFITI